MPAVMINMRTPRMSGLSKQTMHPDNLRDQIKVDRIPH